jgi:hypothetical protein
MLVAAALFFLRGPIVATGLQWAVRAATKEHLSYDQRVWEKGVLTYTGVKVGDFLSAEKLEVDFAWSRPFYLESHVVLSRPHITVDLESKSNLLYALLLPSSKFFGMKWTIDEGSVDVGDAPFKFTFLSGESREDLGRLVLYDQGVDIMHPLCVCAFGVVDHLVQAQIEVPSVSVERLEFLSTLMPANRLPKWKMARGDVSIQGQVLVDKMGAMNALSASIHLQSFMLNNTELSLSVEGEDLQTVFDYSFKEKGSFWSRVYVDSALQGGHLLVSNLAVSDCLAVLSLKPGEDPYLELSGDVECLEKRYPLGIMGIGKVGPDLLTSANLHCTLGLENGEKTEIGAILTQDKASSYQMQCDLHHVGKEAIGLVQQVSLLWGAKEEVDFGSGWICGKVGGLFENGELRKLQCDDVELVDGYLQLPRREVQGFIEKAHFSATFDKQEAWKIATFECDVTQGAISSKDWKGSDLNGNISIRNHAFEKSLLKGAFHGVPVEISFAGSVDAFEMTTEFVDDSKSWFELLMGKSAEGLDSFPIALRGITNKHEQGYSFNGTVTALSEEIQVGMDLDLTGNLKQGWFFSHKFSDQMVTPFLAFNAIPVALGGELSFYGVFDKASVEAFIQGDNLSFETESLIVKLPHLGVKDPEFLTADGWAHITYTFTDKFPKVSFPFKEATLTQEGIFLEHLKGNVEWVDHTIKLTQLAGKCREIQMQADASCTLSLEGDIDVQVKGKWIEGDVENLLSLMKEMSLTSLQIPVTGKFISGANPFQITANHVFTDPKVAIHFETFFQDLQVALPNSYKLDKVHCGFVFDSKTNTSAITHLTGHFVTPGNKYYQLESDSLLCDHRAASYLFDAKLHQEGEAFPILSLHGEALAKSPKRVAFTLTGSCYSTFLDKVEFELEDGKGIVSFCSKSRSQGKDFIKQLNLLENFGIVSCNPSILEKISTLEGEVDGTLLFSPNVGFLFEAQGKNLKIEQEPIPNFELKGKKIADHWILEKMDIGGIEIKGSLSKAEDKWFSPYWEIAWQGKRIKGDALYQAGVFSIHLSKAEGLFPPSYTLRSEGNSPIVFSPNLGIKNLSLLVHKDGQKIGAFTTDLLEYKDLKLESANTHLLLNGSSLQGPFYVALSTADKKIRFHTLHNPQEMVHISFSDIFRCEQIEGKWLGLNFHLQQAKTAHSYLGSVQINDGTQLAACFPKDLFFCKEPKGLN